MNGATVLFSRGNQRLVLVPPEAAHVNRDLLRPFFELAERGRPLTAVDCDAEALQAGAQTGELVLVGVEEDGDLELLMGLQVFQGSDSSKGKAATIVFITGRNLVRLGRAWFPAVTRWLKSSGVRYLESVALPKDAKVYEKLFGFDASHVYVRREL